MNIKWSRTELSLLLVPLAVVAAGWMWNVQKTARESVIAPAPTQPIVVVPTPKPTTPAKIREARAIHDIVAAPDGQSVWTINLLDGKLPIHQFSLSAGTWMRTVGGEVERWSNALKISPDGRDLIFGASGKPGVSDYVEIFDVKSGKSRLKMPEGSGTTSVAIAPDGQSFALGYGGHFEIRALSDARLLHLIHWQGGGEMKFLDGACYSSDGRYFAVSDANQHDDSLPNPDGEIGVFSTQTWKPVATYRPPRSQVSVFDFAGTDQLAVRSYELNKPSKLELYNFLTRQNRLLRTIETGGDYNLAVSPDQRYVAITDYMSDTLDEDSGRVIAEIYDVQSGDAIAMGEVKGDDYIPCLTFSSDSRALLMGAENAKVLRWAQSKWTFVHPTRDLSRLHLN